MSAAVIAAHKARRRRQRRVKLGLTGLVLALFAITLMFGNTFYGPADVLSVIFGQPLPGASFTVGELRLPRGTLAILAGASFGLAGVTFQSLLRNPLASPDIIGISWGASATAVIAIVILGLTGPWVSVFALGGALLAALAIYLLSNRGGFAGTRLILIGIGVGAMLQSVVLYVLSLAAEWDLQTAMQWLSGSLNNASWDRVVPVALVCLLVIPVLLLRSRSLDILRLGDDSAASLGIPVERTRIELILLAVVLLAVATAATGPIVFVAFMAGPIAARLSVRGANLLVAAALVGAALVLASDFVAQFAFPTRYPVGIVTGIAGAPFLLYLLIRTNRSGASL